MQVSTPSHRKRIFQLLDEIHMKFELLTGKIEKATKESAAFDLFYNGEEPLVIQDAPIAIPTGVRTKFDPRLVAIIKEKSGLAVKGVELKAGVIDADYRDEWKVIARFPQWEDDETVQLMVKGKDDLTKAQYTVMPGQKIAQFVLIELPNVTFQAHTGAFISIKAGERVGGLGSTGLS